MLLLTRPGDRLPPFLMAALSLAVGLAIVRPFVDVPVSFDTQATAVYFDRLIHGLRLEQALSTTPKPFLTIVEGAARTLTGDWRLIVWLTLAAQAAASGLAVVLARRAAGTVAGLAAGLVVAGTPMLIEDAAFGNAVSWALLGWLAAGAFLIAERPRPVAAGIVLGLAALCRLETLVVVSVVGLALLWARFGPWFLPGPRPTVVRSVWLAVLLPFASLPIMLLHDWLLTGDMFFWMKVSQRYTHAHVQGILDPLERLAWFVRRYLKLWPALVLGLLGAWALFRGRRWGHLVGLIAIGPGIAAFILLLAARGLYAPERYALPVDLALFLLAAVGLASVIGTVAKRAGDTPAATKAVAGAVFTLGFVACALFGAGPFDPAMNRVIWDLRILNENTGSLEPRILQSVESSSLAVAPRLVVPTAVRPRVALDLGIRLGDVAGMSLGWIDPSKALLRDGQVVLHDLHGDIPGGGYGILEGTGPVKIGEFTLQPIEIDQSRGVWLYLVVH